MGEEGSRARAQQVRGAHHRQGPRQRAQGRTRLEAGSPGRGSGLVGGVGSVCWGVSVWTASRKPPAKC